MPSPAQTTLPRWRGFNLLEMFTTRSDGAWQENDFRSMAAWGFDWVRLPMCYTLWTEPDDPFALREEGLVKVDHAVRLGERYGIHVCLNLHRAPGYSVNRERQEPFNLWTDDAALEAFCFHWEAFARRYAGIPSGRLSFNLVNEPCDIAQGGLTRERHEAVMRTAVAAIRAIDPRRLIILDGLAYGRLPCPELADLGVAQSCRAYNPMGLTHYKANWVSSVDNSVVPTWPGSLDQGRSWDRTDLEALYAPWIALAQQGVGVHCGEGGAYQHTPHDVLLRWLEAVLEILKAANIGWALWNLRGPFGVLDSGRADVAYEDWHGHALDRKLLQLLQGY
jgi:endoglucanase